MGSGVSTLFGCSPSLVLRQVSLHVERQVIAARKAALADDALEGLGAGVFAVVSRQLVGACEAPFALGPLARIRLFTCKQRSRRGKHS